MGQRAAVLTATAPPRHRRIAPLDRIESVGVRQPAAEIDWDTPIDRSRWFFCETLTPLYYTPTYATLTPEQRRRYNQLTGMLSNELILRLETGFLDTALDAVVRRNGGVGSEDLIEALRRFRDDEQRHAEGWRRLNLLSEPEWYRTGQRRLVYVPAALDVVAHALARHPFACPVVFWIQLVQEERSIEISRRCLRMSRDVIEPRYAAVYGEHLRDEVRHVQLDCHLIERFHASQSLAMRRVTAALFRWVMANMFLRPSRSAVRVVQALVAEHPELHPLRPTMVRELRALTSNAEYQQMMYSRRTTPITFALFDRFSEFHSMRQVLRAYTPAVAGSHR
jgi:hypothetical protein